MDKTSKIYIAGHTGLVGSSLMRTLQQRGFTKLITRTSRELDLRRQTDVEAFFEQEKPEYIFLAAAKVGGILANSTYKADFIYDNIMIACNIIDASYKSGVTKLLNLGSSCIYPRMAAQPIKESDLLTGLLEPTNEAYAIAKIAAIKLCRYYNEQHGTNFISLMPTNMYGPNDNFDMATSHVLPAMIRKFHEAKIKGHPSVTLWGTGRPYREFLFVDDLADACCFLMSNFDYATVGEIINIGVGKDCTINELAELIREVVGFKGAIEYDTTKPDGTPRKLLDVSRMSALGWTAKTDLRDGLNKTYDWFIRQYNPAV